MNLSRIQPHAESKLENNSNELLAQAAGHLERISKTLGDVENLNELRMHALQDCLIRLHLSLECLETLRRNYIIAPRIIKQLKSEVA
jgi:hypothetical protein